jgi:hypothetical protein
MITQVIPIDGGISNLDFIYEKLIFLVLVGLVCFRVTIYVWLFNFNFNLFHWWLVFIAWNIKQT